MDRRLFLQLAATSPLLGAPVDDPVYKVVTPFKPAAKPGMPGPYPGRVIRIHSANSINTETDRANRDVVKQMISNGIRALTGYTRDSDAWARFVSPSDVVGIKVNCSGAPKMCSSPEVVGEIATNLVAIGVPPQQIYIYERFESQLRTVPYKEFVPPGVTITAAESSRGSILGYDPRTYVETSFFGEEDTRSNLVRLVGEKLTKIINVPNMKEHRAAGVTGCLKNIAYGNFSNMDRSHRFAKTNTLTFIGTLANTEPVRSRVVLNIMDGLRGVWHGGPFMQSERFRFYPKQIMIGTDPVAMDRQLIHIIEEKRKAEGAVSIFDRAPERIGNALEPNINPFIREPGHVEYASKLGLGVFDESKITVKAIEI